MHKQVIDKDTELYFSISGYPGNFGATLYNAAFNHLNINAIYKPLKFSQNSSLSDLLKSFYAIGVKGVSVSSPFKSFAYNCSAKSCIEQVQNCNTLVYDQNLAGYRAYNTDVLGFLRSIDMYLPNIKTATIYGTGAVSDSIEYALRKENVITSKMSRKVAYSSSFPATDLFVNATRTGMDGTNEEVWTVDVVNKYKYVFDVVVKKETKLMSISKKLNKYTIPGWLMSSYQLMEQFYLYTGRVFPEHIMNEKIEQMGFIK